MTELWKNIVVTEIGVAVYVAPGGGKSIHKNRPFHGLVLNDAACIKDYVFEDGHVLHVEGNDLFYLPKGSSYHVKSTRHGGCYAINFDAALFDAPFAVHLRNHESLLQQFRAAADAWREKNEIRRVLAMRAVYDAVYQMQKELKKQYVSGTQTSLIAPALEQISSSFTQNDLSVSHLAALCGISEVYFRRLFASAFGVPPKEYIIQKRIEYAKTLLRSGNFSVVEVSQSCGYAEPCHFSREFSKRVGCAPNAFAQK